MKQKSKILVVDDDPNLRKTLADILRIKGYETTVAASGAEAIAAAEHETFSLALIDLMLPDLPGLEVMTRIKTIAPLTEAIILTGNASMDTAIEATRQGAYSYLLKPYQMDDLLRNIRHGVERQQAQEEIIRLASFPRLTPIPVIEVNSSGEVTYANPAAEKLFPDLNAMGLSHPLLNGLPEFNPDSSLAIQPLQNQGVVGRVLTRPLRQAQDRHVGLKPDLRPNGLPEFNELRQSRQQADVISEVEVGQATYELHTHYIPGLDLIRVYGLDITQRKLAEKEIHLLATTDSLTGIANRREFATIMAGEVGRAKRYGTPLSLAMYDLDFFKRVNDTFGHDTGDYVLQAVTGVVKENIRTTDVVARWGGEEFMVLMPQTDPQAARNVAEKLRLAIAGYCFDKVNKLTVSFGVVSFGPQDDLNSLLKRVDDALYRAKEQGRNRVEILSNEEVFK